MRNIIRQVVCSRYLCLAYLVNGLNGILKNNLFVLSLRWRRRVGGWANFFLKGVSLKTK